MTDAFFRLMEKMRLFLFWIFGIQETPLTLTSRESDVANCG